MTQPRDFGSSNFDMYILCHVNEQCGPLCEYPYKKNAVARISVMWVERGGRGPVKFPVLKRKFPVKWVRIRDTKHLQELFT